MSKFIAKTIASHNVYTPVGKLTFLVGRGWSPSGEACKGQRGLGKLQQAYIAPQEILFPRTDRLLLSLAFYPVFRAGVNKLHAICIFDEHCLSTHGKPRQRSCMVWCHHIYKSMWTLVIIEESLVQAKDHTMNNNYYDETGGHS